MTLEEAIEKTVKEFREYCDNQEVKMHDLNYIKLDRGAMIMIYDENSWPEIKKYLIVQLAIDNDMFKSIEENKSVYAEVELADGRIEAAFFKDGEVFYEPGSREYHMLIDSGYYSEAEDVKFTPEAKEYKNLRKIYDTNYIDRVKGS